MNLDNIGYYLWSSVRASVENSVGNLASVRSSVSAFVWASVRNTVRVSASVRNTIRVSIGDSMRSSYESR